MSQIKLTAQPAAEPHLGASGVDESDRLFSIQFLILNICAFFSAVSFSTQLPLISLLVVERTGGGNVAVGFAISAFAITAVAARPTIGMLGDQRGRRFLVVTGCALTALTTYGHVWANTYAAILLVRLLIGAFQGAFFVGSAAMVSDLAPEHRRGEALNWFSVSIYGGMAIGPWVGETTRSWGDTATSFNGFDVAFTVSGTLMLAAAGIAVLLPREESLLRPNLASTAPLNGDTRMPLSAELPRRALDFHDHARPSVFAVFGAGEPTAEASSEGFGDPKSTLMSRLLYRSAIWPGTILAAGIIIFPALHAYLPKLATEHDLGDFGPVLALYGVLVLVIRIIGRKLPDQLGVAKSATLALTGAALGMMIIATFVTPLGLYAGVVVLALGGSLLYPALMVAAVDGVPPHERARAVSTFTMFFELAAGFGGPILGLTAAIVGATTGAFYAAAACSLIGLGLLWIWQRAD